MARPMTPEHAEFWLQDILLGALKNESRTTRKVLDAVPAARADYRPEPNSRTALELARHIAAAENRFLETPVRGAFHVDAGAIPDGVKTPAEVAVWYSDTFAKNFDKLSQLQGEQLVKIVDFRGMFQLPAVSFLQLAMVHSIHHRGQLSSYLRCMGAKVPSIYGESYDDAQARKATQTA
jgi:uncharacterized damage-inducible protein DinB